MAKRRTEATTVAGAPLDGETMLAQETPARTDESDVKRPTLTATKKVSKPAYEQPGSNNMSREDIGAKENQ